MNSWGIGFFLACTFRVCAGACTFPYSLRHTWTTSSNDNITITSSTIEDYPVATFGTFTLDCDQYYGGQYIAKSQSTITVFGLTMYVYFCFDFKYVNSNLYYYYLGSNDSNGYQTVFRMLSSTPTAAEVCALSSSQYETGRYQVMIKNGDVSAAKVSCPTDLAASWEYGIDSGSGNTCSITSGQLNGCTGSQITANYTACSTRVFYSNAGLVYCLASVTSGSTTYLTVYNTDATVDNTNYFRMACLVFEMSGETLYLTQYPEACESGQTPTTVTTPTGAKLTMTGYTACPTTPETTSITLYVVLGVIGGLVGLFLIGLVIFMLVTWKGKQRPFRGKLEPQKPRPHPKRIFELENGFKKRKDVEKEVEDLEKAEGRDSSPENEDDRPINVMQLLRKDVLTPGGRDTPASNVLLSITTPNPYSGPDGDGTPRDLPTPADNSLLKKHYHVIGAEPPIDNLEEYEGEYVEACDHIPTTPTTGGRPPITPRTPVMVMPVQAEGSDQFEGGENDSDDDAMGGLYDSDGQSTLVAARQGVGIHEPMCPPSRLPPIDEGPASHRSYTGSGNNSRQNGNHTATFSEHNPTIFEEHTPRSDCDTPLSFDVHHGSHCSDDLHSRSGTPSGRRSSLGMVYKMEGNKMVAIPDIIEQVEMGSGTADKKQGDKKTVTIKGRKPDGARLKPMVRSAGGRRGSGGLLAVKGATALNDPKRKRSPVLPGRAKSDKGKLDLVFTDEEDFKPKNRVKVTRVDIPELLPPGELEARAPGENELLESPGHCYQNPAYEADVCVDGGGGEASNVSPRKVWLQPVRGTDDVWGKVSSLWKIGHAWPDKTT